MVLILLIAQIIIALNDLLPNRFVKKNLDLYGVILSVLTIIFVIIGIGAFAAAYPQFDTWPETGFYGGIIAGIVNTLLFFLKYRNK